MSSCACLPKAGGLALNSANKYQTKNPRGFSEVGKNKQLLITIVIFPWLVQLGTRKLINSTPNPKAHLYLIDHTFSLIVYSCLCIVIILFGVV